MSGKGGVTVGRDTGKKVLELQEEARKISDFQELVKEYEIRNERMIRICQELTPAQQEGIFDYIGLLIELQNKLLLYALEKK